MQSKCVYFEKKLALHTAPALLGIKPACLVSMDCSEALIKENITTFNKKASVRGLRIKVICSCESRSLLLLYNVKLLSRQLSAEENIRVLEKYGYNGAFKLNQYLEILSRRIEGNDRFPHEIGIFLGYPLNDVLGFIENGGENYLLCGFWKVYSNPEKACRTFENYGKCRKFLCNKLNQGHDIYQALKIS